MSRSNAQPVPGAMIPMTDTEREVLSYWHAFMTGVHVPFAFVRYCGGDWQAAAMLAQLFYWFRPDRDGADKTTVVIDGQRFVAKRHSHWEDLMLSAFEAKRGASKLADLGLVQIEHAMFDGMRTCHYRINFDTLKARITPTGGTEFAPTGGSKFAPTGEGKNAPTGRCKKPPTGGTESAPTIKEKTTAETTAEITAEITEKSGADADLEAPATATGNDTDATSASALVETEHWAGGSSAFNSLVDQIALWMGKATAGLHPATAKAIKSGGARLLAREVTAEDIELTYGRRWFREHWAGRDRSKSRVDRSPRNLRQIEDWIAQCDATPEPADRLAIDEALAVSAAASVDAPTPTEPPTAHPWLAEAVRSMGVINPSSVYGKWLAGATLQGVEDGVAVVVVEDEGAAGWCADRLASKLVWPVESGVTATRFVAAVA